ncbi:MAG: hypothetical protein LBM00_05135, partial [Deltaproteobacteria bacterium]|nr:hypothetical protein [Deltaproteobacteria bacterium]
MTARAGHQFFGFGVSAFRASGRIISKNQFFKGLTAFRAAIFVDRHKKLLKAFIEGRYKRVNTSLVKIQFCRSQGIKIEYS